MTEEILFTFVRGMDLMLFAELSLRFGLWRFRIGRYHSGIAHPIRTVVAMVAALMFHLALSFSYSLFALHYVHWSELEFYVGIYIYSAMMVISFGLLRAVIAASYKKAWWLTLNILVSRLVLGVALTYLYYRMGW